VSQLVATEQLLQLLTAHSVQTLDINPYPESHASAVVKSLLHLFNPTGADVHKEHPLSAEFGP